MRARRLRVASWIARLCLAGLASAQEPLFAQNVVVPEAAYIFPPGVSAGATTEVMLGGYELTPDTQYFVLTPGVKLEVLGPPGRLLIEEPPHVTGPKAYNPLPLPREAPARIVVPAGTPPGPVRWQTANANGVGAAGTFVVTAEPDAVETPSLACLPATVSGRLERNEEVDGYRFRALRSGPVTCDLMARRIGSPFHGVLEVRDSDEKLVADAADTQGSDPVLTFAAREGTEYTVRVHDLDFRGHRSLVYRLAITPGPRVVAAFPAAGRRGESRPVRFLVDRGTQELESVMKTVDFFVDPDRDAFSYRLETKRGIAPPFQLLLSNLEEMLESSVEARMAAPCAVTGTLEKRDEVDRYAFEGKKGSAWRITAIGRRIGSLLDPAVAVTGPGGKEIARCDDLPGTTDAAIDITLPEDGAYEIAVGGVRAGSDSRPAAYRLALEPPAAGFELEVPERLSVPVGEKADVTVKAARRGVGVGAIALAFKGLPPGVSAPADLVIPAGAAELKITLEAARDAPSEATLVTVTGTARIAENLAPRSPDGNKVATMLVATTLKPRSKIWPEESDERTVSEGSTHLSITRVERLEGFEGDLIVQMRSRQPQKFRQGFAGPDVVLPAGVSRFNYPCFVPEGLETVDAYRMSLCAVAIVPDSRGARRRVVSAFPEDVSIGLTVEGALLKVSTGTRELRVKPGETVEIPVKVLRSPKIAGPVTLELDVPAELKDFISAEPVVLPQELAEAVLRATCGARAPITASRTVRIRATALAASNDLPAIAETSAECPLDASTIAHFKSGRLPTISSTEVRLDVVGSAQ